MEWIAGENCDVILRHRNHADLPLILYQLDGDDIGPRVRAHYETYWPEKSNVDRATPTKARHLWFRVKIADEMLGPDGSWFPLSVAEIQRRFNAILGETTDISLITRAGMIMGLYSDHNAVINTIYQGAQTVEVYLSTRSLKDLPIGADALNVWLEEGMTGVHSKWGAAIWQ